VKKAVISTGSKQYLVTEGETLEVELLKSTTKTISFEPLLVIDGDRISIGTPLVSGAEVKADIVEADMKADKVTGVRYKAKKRVHKVHGHRQHRTVLKIGSIS
jgi:large subunit ribosomal protein L21